MGSRYRSRKPSRDRDNEAIRIRHPGRRSDLHCRIRRDRSKYHLQGRAHSVVVFSTRRFPMRHRLLIALIVIVGLVPAAAFSQAKVLRTPDGHPDLQGVWSFATITPLV